MKTNWRAISEVAAALSIVLSLVFVGFEIQQSSSVARVEALLSYTSSISEHQRTIAQDPELAALIYDATNGIKADLSELTSAERAQLYTLYMSVLSLYYGLYSSVEENILPPEYLAIIEDPSIASPIFRELWPTMRVLFGAEFSAFIDTRLLQD